jgi:hypothetical protein
LSFYWIGLLGGIENLSAPASLRRFLLCPATR